LEKGQGAKSPKASPRQALGGWLLNLGGDSFVYCFAAVAVISLAMFAAVLIVDSQIEPAWQRREIPA
jgi:hypothetical protein